MASSKWPSGNRSHAPEQTDSDRDLEKHHRRSSLNCRSFPLTQVADSPWREPKRRLEIFRIPGFVASRCEFLFLFSCFPELLPFIKWTQWRSQFRLCINAYVSCHLV